MAVQGAMFYLSVAWFCCIGVTVVGNLWCFAAVVRHCAGLRPADVLVLTITLANLTTALFPVLMYALVTILDQTWPEHLCKVFVWSLLSFKMVVSLSVMAYTATRVCDRSRSRPRSFGVSGECATALSLATCLLPMIVCVVPVVGIAPLMSNSSSEFYTNGQCAFSLTATGLEYAVFYMCALFALLCVGIAAVELIFIRTRKATGRNGSESDVDSSENRNSTLTVRTAKGVVLDTDRTARQWDFAAVGVTVVCYLLGDVPFLVTNLLDVIVGRNPIWLPPTLVSACLVQTAVAPWVFLIVCERYRPRCCVCCRKGKAKEQQPAELSAVNRIRDNTDSKASVDVDIPRPHSRVTWAQDGDASDDSTSSEEGESARRHPTLPTVDEEDERPPDPAATLARILLSAKRPERSSEEELEEVVKPTVSRRHEPKRMLNFPDTNNSSGGDIWISGLTEDIVNGKFSDSGQPIPTPRSLTHARLDRDIQTRGDADIFTRGERVDMNMSTRVGSMPTDIFTRGERGNRDISTRGEPDGLPPSQLFDGNTSAFSNAVVRPPVPQKRKHTRPPPLYTDLPQPDRTRDGKGFRPYKKDQSRPKHQHSGPPPPYNVALSKLHHNKQLHTKKPDIQVESSKASSSSLEIIGRSGHVSDSDTDSSAGRIVPKVRFTHPLALENRAFVASPEEITQLYSPDEEEDERDVVESVTPCSTPTSPHRGLIALKSLDTRLASQYSVTDQGEMVWHTADRKPIPATDLEPRSDSVPTSPLRVLRTPSPGRQAILLSSLEASWV